MVRLSRFFFGRRELFQDSPQVHRGFAERNRAASIQSISEQPDLVSPEDCCLRQVQRRRSGVIEFAESADACSHQAAAIDHQPDGLTALHLILAYYQFSAPSG